MVSFHPATHSCRPTISDFHARLMLAQKSGRPHNSYLVIRTPSSAPCRRIALILPDESTSTYTAAGFDWFRISAVVVSNGRVSKVLFLTPGSSLIPPPQAIRLCPGRDFQAIWRKSQAHLIVLVAFTFIRGHWTISTAMDSPIPIPKRTSWYAVNMVPPHAAIPSESHRASRVWPNIQPTISLLAHKAQVVELTHLRVLLLPIPQS